MKTKPLTLFLTGGLLGLALALLVLMAGPTHAAPAAVLTVCPAGPPGCMYSDIQDAVDAADQGDVIKVATGVYTGVHNFGGLIQVVYISKTVTLRGGYTAPDFPEPPDPEANPTTLDAQGRGRVLFIAGNGTPTVEGLRITRGSGFEGAGIYAYGTASIINNEVFGNNASLYGGGLYLNYSDSTIHGNSIYSNTAEYGGGVYLNYSDATLDMNTIRSNSVDGWGGGLCLYRSAAVLDGNVIASNTSPSSDGGGVFVYESNGALFQANTISANEADDEGGGLYLQASDVVLDSNTIAGNTAYLGGALCAKQGTVDLNANIVVSNTSDSTGGGLFLAVDAATLVMNTIRNNISNSQGGGVYTQGGGVFLGADSALLHGNSIVANKLAYGGGGGLLLYASNSATLEGNTFISNTATYGGGLFVSHSDAVLVNNLLAGNVATNEGSGVFILASVPRLVHTTLAHNTGGNGSGIQIEGDGTDRSTVVLTNTIVVSHTVGIRVSSGNTATLEATLWANDTDWAGSGTIVTGTINLWGDPAFVEPDAGDYHISPGSAAIDTGIDAGVTTDIDGEPRPMGAGYDIGADELFFGPRLEVVKHAYPDPVQTGSPLTYTLRLTNTGTVSLTTTVTDVLPPHVTPGGSYVWTPAPILPGETWTETVVATVELGYVGPLTNVVQVSSEQGAMGAYTNTVTVTRSSFFVYLPLVLKNP